MSRVQQASGARFEAWVEAQHNTARHRGLLIHAEHTQAAAQVIHGRLVYAAPGVADYILCLAGGRYGAVEAKAFGGPRLYKKRVSPLQARHLSAVARAGALALLITKHEADYFAIPWLEVPWEQVQTADSVCATSLAPWMIAPGACYLERFVGSP